MPSAMSPSATGHAHASSCADRRAGWISVVRCPFRSYGQSGTAGGRSVCEDGPVSPSRAAWHAGAGLAAVGAAGLAYASLIERNAFTLRRASVPVLPPGTASLRVLHVSDIHLVPRQSRKIKWIRSLAALDPDLVVNTGDNLADVEAVPAVLRALEPLLAVPGVFVLGSNDYFAPSIKNPGLYLTSAHDRPIESMPLPTADLVDAFTDAG